MTTSNQLPSQEPLAETLLTTDNVGAVEAPQETVAPDTLKESVVNNEAEKADTLESDNLDISESPEATPEQ
jgi:hypothetical protein